ncbi:MAG: phage tail protein [Cytophagales bacterium]|nr:phage tail protein [Cytophagales bacterium]
MAAAEDTPIVPFLFLVEIDGFSGSDDVAFQEVEGLKMGMNESLEIFEGGLNTNSYKLPTSVSYPDLVLRKGVMPDESPVTDWFVNTLSSGFSKPITPKEMKIQILSPKGGVMRAWKVMNAYPKMIEFSKLDAASGGFFVQTLVMAYDNFLPIKPERELS